MSIKRFIKFNFLRELIYSRWTDKYRVPPVLYIECTNICNADCVFCRYGEYKDSIDFKIMSMEYFSSVLDQYVGIGGREISITPTMADPLTDPLLSDRIRFIDKTDVESLSFYTNGISLKGDVISSLEDVRDTKISIRVSISGFSRKRYNDIMRVDKFERVKKNLLKMSQIGNPNIHVKAVLRVAKIDVSDAEKFSSILQKENVCFSVEREFDSWGGKRKDALVGGFDVKTRNSGIGPCRTSFQKPLVTVNGDVKLCDCRDSDDDLVVGSLNNSTLTDILWGDDMMRLRGLFFKEETMPLLCRKCEIYRSIY